MSRNPRIIQIINSASDNRGGAEKMVRLLHQKFLSRGRDAWIVGLEDDEEDRLENHIGLELRSPYAPFALPKLRQRLGRLTDRPSVVHAHLFPSGAYASLLKRFKLLNQPLVYTEHSTQNRRRKGHLLRRLDGFAYSGYTRVACISEGVRTSLLSAQPHASKISDVIQNGIEIPNSDSNIGYLERERTIVSACRLNKVKNLDIALRAFALMKDKSVRYLILGDGPEMANLKAVANSLGVEDRVEFKGFRKDVFEFFGRSRVFLIPSHWEGFGLAAVEAMSCGLPVIASNVPGLSEVVGDEERCGFLVDQTSPQKIADALDRVFERSDEAARMSEYASKRARSFNIDATVRAYEKLYDAISA